MKTYYAHMKEKGFVPFCGRKVVFKGWKLDAWYRKDELGYYRINETTSGALLGKANTLRKAKERVAAHLNVVGPTGLLELLLNYTKEHGPAPEPEEAK